MDYRIQRLKEDLTNAQQRNKKQRIQLANYKKVHERDLETIKKYKEIFDKANNWVRNYMDEWSRNDEVWQELNELLILLEEVK